MLCCFVNATRETNGRCRSATSQNVVFSFFFYFHILSRHKQMASRWGGGETDGGGERLIEESGLWALHQATLARVCPSLISAALRSRAASPTSSCQDAGRPRCLAQGPVFNKVFFCFFFAVKLSGPFSFFFFKDTARLSVGISVYCFRRRK